MQRVASKSERRLALRRQLVAWQTHLHASKQQKYIWLGETCPKMWNNPSHIMISASGNTSLTALAKEESSSCQWTAACIPSSLALRNVRRAAYPSADLDVPLYNSSSMTLSRYMLLTIVPLSMSIRCTCFFPVAKCGSTLSNV